MANSTLMNYRIEGLVAAVSTPMTDNEEVNLEVISDYVDHLLSVGVDQVFVNGTGGEGISLTVDERKEVVEAWMKYGTNRLKTIMVHVGACSIKDSIELAKHGQKVGVTAISTIGPFFFKPTTPGHLVEFCRRIAEAAPELPFYYYHIPAMTGISVDVGDFLIEAEKKIPNFRGMKFSSPTMYEVKLCSELTARRHNFLYGNDNQLAGALSMKSVDGAVGTMYNYMPRVAQRVIDAVKIGDLETASREQHKIQRVWKAWSKYAKKTGGAVGTWKELVSMVMGVSVGPPRCPMSRLEADDISALREELREMGFFDWIQ